MTTQTIPALSGPHLLTSATIDQVVTKVSPGVYVLSRDGKAARYVGRSDNDLKTRLKDWVPTAYLYFWYSYASSPKDAFLKECLLYHRYGGSSVLDNRIHPARPENTNWRCPDLSCLF
jgi:hypothetical protein